MKKNLQRIFPSTLQERIERSHIERSLLGFHFDRFWIASPYRAFRPQGLLIWNPPAKSVICCEITNSKQIQSSYDMVPAAWFATAKSFEQLAAEIESGKELAAWCTWDSVYPGQTIKLEILSYNTHTPFTPNDGIELVMWGYTQKE
jgi:hypothetical protein